MSAQELVFAVPEAFAKKAWIDAGGYRREYERSMREPQAFWREKARTLDWVVEPTRIRDVSFGPDDVHIRWFEDGKLNVSANCLDRHLATRGGQAAILWEGDDPSESRTITYRELHEQVCRLANGLKSLGVRRGDRVTIYLPMVPEAAIAMLACARIGAPHSVVFAGFSAESLAGRMLDCGSEILITADEGWRAGKRVPLKANADDALRRCPSVRKCIVLERTGAPVAWTEGRDVRYRPLVDAQPAECDAEPMGAEDPLFILYTSGSTGKPKGALHTTGGYLLAASLTHRLVLDYHDGDVFWCTADVGWVTGHSYVVYGPLANGATCVMYEGAPDWPDKDRFWALIAKHHITILYTAPTAIRAFMKWGDQYPARHDLSSLRLLGSVGEPINPEAWMWYSEHIGHNRCPVVDTWWQTETGAIIISPLPGITSTTPGSATRPLPGCSVDLLDSNARSIPLGGGFLALTRPIPSMLRTIWGDDARYQQTYFSKWPGHPELYFPGDGAKRDADGYFWVLGRVDDVLNVAGHRIGTMEVESALVEHPAVAEAAVVGRADEMKGQALAAFVTVRATHQTSPELATELKQFVSDKIGAIARPDDVIFAADLPKTRSGKIMRRLLRDIAEGRALGDTTTLADPAVVAGLKAQYESLES
jgi:acetyl-CoA synthetase